MRRGAAILAAGALAVAILAVVVAVTREKSTTEPASRFPEIANGGTERRPVVLDARRQQLAGIRTERVARGTLSRVVRGAGVVAFDEGRLTDVNLKLEGWIRELYVDHTGQVVTRGQPLLSLYSQELMGAQLQYLAALRSLDQLTAAQKADRDYEARLIETPRRRLLNWDVPDDQIRALEKAGLALDAVIFRAPADGVVIEKSATRGMHVEAGKSLYTLADTSVLWVEADFNPADAALLKPGQQASLAVGTLHTGAIGGKVLHVYPALSEPSRSTRVRIELPNRDGRFKAGMYASVEVAGEPAQGIVVPADSVIDSGRQRTVFIARGNGRFEPRTVVAGFRSGNQIIVQSGLEEGTEIVTRATFLLDSESQLQAALESYAAPEAAQAGAVVGKQPTLAFGIDPDPPRVGKNELRVQLVDAAAAPVTDASIVARFSMAPMPAMNMPAMHAGVRLDHAGGGVYRGTGTLTMAGAWELTISASRDGRAIAEARASLVVR